MDYQPLRRATRTNSQPLTADNCERSNPGRVEGQPGAGPPPTRGGSTSNPGRVGHQPGAGRGSTRGGCEGNPGRMRRQPGAGGLAEQAYAQRLPSQRAEGAPLASAASTSRAGGAPHASAASTSLTVHRSLLTVHCSPFPRAARTIFRLHISAVRRIIRAQCWRGFSDPRRKDSV